MPDTTPISLYIKLAPGTVADLDVVARTALAFSAAVREMAATVDPMSEVRIELASGTEGSLSLNSIIRRIKGAVPSRAQLKVVVLAVLVWMGEHGGEWAYDKVLDALKGEHAEVTKGLSQAEIEDIARQVSAALGAKAAEQPKRQVFHELERDQSIIGVGATVEPGSIPSTIIPRSEFAARAGQSADVADEDRRRTVVSELSVVLVSPVLKDAERSWRFQHGSLPEFGAVMKDHDFLEALKLGRIAVAMRPGVEMKIELHTKEELEEGVWTVRERSVPRVIYPDDRGQGSLPLPTEQ